MKTVVRSARVSAPRRHSTKASRLEIRKQALLFGLVGEPNRLAILLLLSEDDQTVRNLSSKVSSPTPSSLSQHLLILRLNDLVEVFRRNGVRCCRLTEAGRKVVAAVQTLIEERS